jgi:DNA repair exonuclease SbcCD ATPase subunit
MKAQLRENDQQMAMVEKSVQKVSRDITGLCSKIEDQVSEQTTSDRAAANSKKRIAKIREETAAKEVETENLHNEIARVTVDSLNTQAHNQMLKERYKQLGEDLGQREKLIEQYEQEIRKRHHQIEKKQLYVDRLNREFDEKRTKLESEAGEGDVAGPQEAKLKHMKNTIDDLKKDCEQMQKDWIQKQTQLLQISTEQDNLRSKNTDMRNRKMVLQQKKLRIESQFEAQKKEIKELENAKKHLRFDMQRMTTALMNNDNK